MTNHHRRASFAFAVLLAACAGASDGPVAPAFSPLGRSALLGPNEGVSIISDTTDAAGNTVMVAEYAAGSYVISDTASGSVASVTIKTVIPASGGASSKACITSTIVAIDVVPGWTSSVKKSGGCDKDIVVDLANKSTKQSAQFSFLYKFGSTRIDAGRVR